MPASTARCPDCELVLEVSSDPSGSKLTFDINQWKTRCSRPTLGSPVWCLIQRDGTSPVKNATAAE
jgi:hypothetical protein